MLKMVYVYIFYIYIGILISRQLAQHTAVPNLEYQLPDSDVADNLLNNTRW